MRDAACVEKKVTLWSAHGFVFQRVCACIARGLAEIAMAQSTDVTQVTWGPSCYVLFDGY